MIVLGQEVSVCMHMARIRKASCCMVTPCCISTHKENNIDLCVVGQCRILFWMIPDTHWSITAYCSYCVWSEWERGRIQLRWTQWPCSTLPWPTPDPSSGPPESPVVANTIMWDMLSSLRCTLLCCVINLLSNFLAIHTGRMLRINWPLPPSLFFPIIGKWSEPT